MDMRTEAQLRELAQVQVDGQGGNPNEPRFQMSVWAGVCPAATFAQTLLILIFFFCFCAELSYLHPIFYAYPYLYAWLQNGQCLMVGCLGVA